MRAAVFSQEVDKIVVHLDESFGEDAEQELTKTEDGAFVSKETDGWGEFQVRFDVYLCGLEGAPLAIVHELELFGDSSATSTSTVHALTVP